MSLQQLLGANENRMDEEMKPEETPEVPAQEAVSEDEEEAPAAAPQEAAE